jgi:hypothetical protein
MVRTKEGLMVENPRLNGVIRALEQGKTAFVGFAPVDVETSNAPPRPWRPLRCARALSRAPRHDR